MYSSEREDNKKNWVIHKFPKVQDSYHNTGFSDETESISVLKHSELQYFVDLFVLRFYGQVNAMGSC